MPKIGIAIVGFIIGLFVGTGGFVWLWVEFHPPSSEIWTSTIEMQLENGAVIPVGSEFTVDQYMSEGFVRLELAINVEEEFTGRFKKRMEQVRGLTIPYWVRQ